MQLVEEGALSLQDQAATFAPAFRLKDAAQLPAATLEMVLSHRVGLPPYAYDNLLEAGVAPSEILRRYRDVDLVCRVGRCYAYQNVVFNIAASAVAVAGGGEFEAVVGERLFAPLGLSGASFGMASLKATDNWARPHRRRRGGPWRVVDVRAPYYDVPAAGGVNATIEDMATWLAAQMGARPDVLSQTALATLRTPLVRTPAEIRRMRSLQPRLNDAHYGLGWRVYDYGGATVVNHAGSVEGYSAQIAFLPERDVGIVLLTNSRARPFWDILPLFLDLELGLYEGGGVGAMSAPD